MRSRGCQCLLRTNQRRLPRDSSRGSGAARNPLLPHSNSGSLTSSRTGSAIEYIVVSVTGVLRWFPHLRLFRTVGSYHSTPNLPANQLLNSLEQYHIMLLLGIPQSI